VESNDHRELDDETVDKSGFVGAGVALRGENGSSLTFSFREAERGTCHPVGSLADSAMVKLLTVRFGGWL